MTSINADLATLTATEAVQRIRSGQCSVEDLARACLERIEQRDRAVRAWVHVDADLILANARELDRAGPRGPLHGVPIGIKDVILTADMPTQYNSPLYRGFHPRIDAGSVALLREAGALVFGKTDTVEFATNARRALTRNPHDPAHTPGGSSSGSAAAVADCHVPLAIGTQTGGSIIRPASYCGTYALKPTWGLVSTDGLKPFAPSLDTIGWFGRSADDLALLYEVFDPDPAPQPALDLRHARFALCRTPLWSRAEPATVAALARAAELLRAAGAQVTELALPSHFDELPDRQWQIMSIEGRRSFLAEYRLHRAELHPFLLEQAENAQGYTIEHLRSAYDLAARCRAEFDRIAAGYDAVLAPSALGEAPLGLASTGEPALNVMWTLLHVPCVNVPGLTGPGGLPVGVTLTGPRFTDRKVIAAARALGDILQRQREN